MKYLFLLLLLANIPYVSAQEKQEYDILGNPLKALRTIEGKDNPPVDHYFMELPACDDSALMSFFKQAISEDEKSIVGESIIEYRYRMLAKKHINNFSEQKISDFSPYENRDVANIMATEKVNGIYQDQDFRICISDNPILERKVYLLLQKHSTTEAKGMIINYHPRKIIQFIYKNL